MTVAKWRRPSARAGSVAGFRSGGVEEDQMAYSPIERLLTQIGIDRSAQRLLAGSSNVAGQYSSVEVKGLKELERALSELPEKVARKVLVAAVRDGAELIRARAAQLAPHNPAIPLGKPSWRTMRLREGIKKSVSVKGHGAAGATVRAKVGLDVKHAFFGRFIEKGWFPAGRMHVAPRATRHLRKVTGDLTAIVFTRRNSRAKDAVKTTKQIPARPFMRPAFEQMKQAALDLIRTRLAAGIQRAASELYRRAA